MMDRNNIHFSILKSLILISEAFSVGDPCSEINSLNLFNHAVVVMMSDIPSPGLQSGVVDSKYAGVSPYIVDNVL